MTDSPDEKNPLQEQLAATQMPKIEKGIKIPRAKTGHRKYPWDKMEIGDSFWAPTTQTALTRAAAAHTAYRKNFRKYTVRTEEQDGRAGARCWRIK